MRPTRVILMISAIVLALVLLGQGRLLFVNARVAAADLAGSLDDLQEIQSDPCWATPDEGVTVYSSLDATAVQSAVNASLAGAVVKLAGVCRGVQFHDTTTQTVFISRTLSLQGGFTHTNWINSDPAVNETILDAANQGRVAQVNGTAVTLTSLTLTGGNGGGGLFADDSDLVISNTKVFSNAGSGIILSDGTSLTLTNSIVSHNIAGTGGGIRASGFLSVPIFINGSDISHNTATNGGGIHISHEGPIFIENSVIGHNATTNRGGGILQEEGTLHISGTLIVSNTAGTFGGGVVMDDFVNFNKSLMITNSHILTNQAGGSGGGVYLGTNRRSELNNTNVRGNTADADGGGIYVNGGLFFLQDSDVSLNVAGNEGGGLNKEFYGYVIVTDTSFLTNTAAGNGGGLSIHSGRLTMTHSLVQGNMTDLHGGGIAMQNGALIVDDSVVAFNNAADDGGGFRTWRTDMWIDNSQIVGNEAQLSDSSHGGGIHMIRGELYMTNTSVYDNQANRHGGGIYMLSDAEATISLSAVFSNTANLHGGGIAINDEEARLTLINATVYSNTADYDNNLSGRGGGIHNLGTLSLEFVSIADNKARSGGGLYNSLTAPTAPLTISNSIIAYNVGENCVVSTYYFSDYNLDSDGSCLLPGTHDVSNVDPVLDDFGDHGGSTPTIALASSSPAINTIPPNVNGCGTAVTIDQRGVTRPSGPGCDKGAYEQIFVTLTVTLTGTGSGLVQSNPAGIDCPLTCTVQFLQNQVISLTAVADTDSTFAGWSGACTGLTDCVVTLTDSVSVSAHFTGQTDQVLFLPLILKP